jgi:hypothetical protein
MITAKFILNNYIKSEFLKTGRKAGNCAYFYKNGKQYLITRETDYVYGKFPDGSFQMYTENDGINIIHSDETIYEKYGSNLKFMKKLLKAEGPDWGFEDPRSVIWNNENYLLFARRSLRNAAKFQVNFGKLNNEFAYIENKVNDGKQLIEKNWQPIEGRPGICVYSVKPFQLIDLFNNKYISIENNFPLLLRGSSNIIRYGENYLGIYHIRNDAFEYLHYVVLYDKNMKLLKMSDPFSFFGANVEFNCYIEHKENKFVIPVSIHDQNIYEFEVDDELMQKILDRKLDNSVKDDSVFTRFYNDAKTNNNINAALVIASFSFDKNVLADAIMINNQKNYFRSNYQEVLQTVLVRSYNERL